MSSPKLTDLLRLCMWQTHKPICRADSSQAVIVVMLASSDVTSSYMNETTCVEVVFTYTISWNTATIRKPFIAFASWCWRGITEWLVPSLHSMQNDPSLSPGGFAKNTRIKYLGQLGRHSAKTTEKIVLFSFWCAFVLADLPFILINKSNYTPALSVRYTNCTVLLFYMKLWSYKQWTPANICIILISLETRIPGLKFCCW